MSLISKSAGRRLLLISFNTGGGIEMVAVEKTSADAGWVPGQEAVFENMPLAEALRQFAGQSPGNTGLRQAIVTGPECRLLLLNQSVPANLTPAQVREMLRWDVASALENEDTGLPAGASANISWDTGHAPAGRHQVAVTAVNPVWRDDVEKALSVQGISLLGLVPPMGLGWTLLGAGAETTAIIQTDEFHHVLSVFERGSLDFHSAYPVESATALPRNLVADARSFDVRKLFILGLAQRNSHTAGASTAPAPLPGLPEAEPVATGWKWQAMLHGCLLNGPAQGAQQRIPVITCITPPAPVWQRPVAWWAAAAVIIVSIIAPRLTDGLAQIRNLSREKQEMMATMLVTRERLSAFDKDAEEYARLEAELKGLNEQIVVASREAERPGKAPCAQVAYASEALQSIASAFASRVRVKRFKMDYQGRVCIQGESKTDSAALDALEDFYRQLNKHPVKPAAVTTTKEGARVGHLMFTADDVASPLGGSWTTTVATTTATTPTAQTQPTSAPAASAVPLPGMLSTVPYVPPADSTATPPTPPVMHVAEAAALEADLTADSVHAEPVSALTIPGMEPPVVIQQQQPTNTSVTLPGQFVPFTRSIRR